MREGRLFVVIILLILTYSQVVTGQSDNRQKLEKEKKETLKKIAQAEKILAQTETKRKASLGQLNALSVLIKSRKSLIRSIKKEVNLLNAELHELQTIENAMAGDLKTLKKEYAAMLYSASKTSNSYNKLVFLFSVQTFNEFFMRLKYLEQYGETRINQVEQIKIVKESLGAQRVVIEEKKREKENVLSQQLKENRNLITLQNKQSKIIRSLSSKEKEIKKELAARRRAASRLDKLIADIVKKEIARASGKAAVAESSSFEGKKTKMLWPVPGFISNHFGRQAHQTLKGIVVNNNGVDIQTNKDEKVKSVYSGKVLRVALVPGNGTAVIVKHGEYFTVYSKMKNVSVKTGQDIVEGDIIGEVYTDNNGVSELEFQVWKNNQKLDPQSWLAPK
ncbi:peptidoglycan DD-metalloendopeptidase family protein [Fulvivirgaceae bacterium BMA12]|uniref:Peptidoglycan DD-metalloendopeptidase family protein n=1 Tax=Agaribacillus aureus TaxID=3051825 RepID=A0ABT8LFH1_9BACT|nr:peptidoglycan DD-metalloendopeptidase family protein [Fulvivirgaceae bacterium BMA12]